MIWLIKKLLRKRATTRTTAEPDPGAPLPPARSSKADWEYALILPIEQACTAPSQDAVTYAFGLYRDPVFAPILKLQYEMADLRTDIAVIAAAVNARVPSLIERVMSSHPFEFSHILEQKELR